ncbi:hypothetical protein Ciccas_007200 [Cichlidogyrus casuarinus]|uniref:Uncharacterized protein n=1 Tax=Cichlidogyrus casuarinus TaxID=1844966 RepID=A0ABD2Q647_9PLAT
MPTNCLIIVKSQLAYNSRLLRLINSMEHSDNMQTETDSDNKKSKEEIEHSDFDFPFGSPLVNDSFSPQVSDSRNSSQIENSDPVASSDDDNTDDARPSGSLELRVHNISKFKLEDFQKELKVRFISP